MKALKYIILAIIILPASFFLVGILSPSFTYETSFRTSAPLKTAWEVFIDEDKMDQWITGFKSSRLIEGADNEVGSRYEMVIEQDGQRAVAYEQITAFKEQEQFAFVLDNDFMTIEVDMQFSPEFDGAQVKAHHEVRAKNAFWKSMFRLMKSSMEQQSFEDYQKLKRLMEEEASKAASGQQAS